MAKVLWELKSVLVNFLSIGTKVNFDLNWKFLLHAKCQKRYLSMTNPGHLQVCIPRTPLGNSEGRFCCSYTTTLISHWQIFTCLFAHEDNIMRYRRHFRGRSSLLQRSKCSFYWAGSRMEEEAKKLGSIKNNKLFKWAEWSSVKFSYVWYANSLK